MDELIVGSFNSTHSNVKRMLHLSNPRPFLRGYSIIYLSQGCALPTLAAVAAHMQWMGFIGKWEKYVGNIVDLVWWEARIPVHEIYSNALFHYSKFVFLLYFIWSDGMCKENAKINITNNLLFTDLCAFAHPYRFKSQENLYESYYFATHCW